MSAAPSQEAEFAGLMAPLGPFAFPMVVGCSGGPDSLALAWLAHRWSGGRALAVVVDHGLRPESAAEAAAVAAQLAGFGMPAEIRALHLPAGPRLQERARAARRGALLAACRERGALHLLLGHQAEDQAETLLFRALRGSGAAGLAAMAPLAVAPEALILRPLLGIPRARLVATCAAAGLVPLQDPSNADPRFARVRLRAAGGTPGLEGAAARFAARRARRAEAIAARAAQAVRLLPEGCAWLDRAALGQDAVAVALLGLLLRAVGGRAHAPAPGAVRALLAAGQGTLGGARLLASGWLVREAPAPAVPAAAGAVWDGRFRLAGARAGQAIGPLGRADAARRRARARHLPAAALAALPALRQDRDGMLAAIPHLTYAQETTLWSPPLCFAPVGGPVAEAWFGARCADHAPGPPLPNGSGALC
ncbi:MAG: tRNA lysidine(34) synthetase TilS [Rubritepida sp.]|nr:tRNA lysidine(34) synthetase TilS [Rubritepida sp.]